MHIGWWTEWEAGKPELSGRWEKTDSRRDVPKRQPLLHPSNSDQHYYWRKSESLVESFTAGELDGQNIPRNGYDLFKPGHQSLNWPLVQICDSSKFCQPGLLLIFKYEVASMTKKEHWKWFNVLSVWYWTELSSVHLEVPDTGPLFLARGPAKNLVIWLLCLRLRMPWLGHNEVWNSVILLTWTRPDIPPPPFKPFSLRSLTAEHHTLNTSSSERALKWNVRH